MLLAPESLGTLHCTWANVAWQAAKRKPLVVIAFCAACLILWLKKARLFDVVVTNWWRLRFQSGDTRSRVIATLRLLDRRSRIYGHPRKKAISLGRWDLLAGKVDSQLGSGFLEIANWALYGDGFLPQQSADEAGTLCREVAKSAFPKGKGPSVSHPGLREKSL